MSLLKLSLQDKKDLEKFTRFLALKVTQIVVQSRSGEKFNTKCKPNSSGTDWVFHNLSQMLKVATIFNLNNKVIMIYSSTCLFKICQKFC